MTKLKAAVLFLVFAMVLPLLSAPLLSRADNTLGGCGDISNLDPLDSYPASSTNSKEVVTKDGCLATIINRSSKNLFVPNRELTEWNAFKANAPQYVTVSVCGDGVCGESESIENCQADCYSPAAASYCGDKRCDKKQQKVNQTRTVIVPKPAICNRGLVGWISSLAENIIFLITGEQRTTFCNSTQTTFQTISYMEEIGETWENCPDDCVPTQTSGCGVCGYNGSGNMCPNYCNGGGMDLTNCIWGGGQFYPPLISKNNDSLKKYFAISEAFALETVGQTLGDYTLSNSWICDFDSMASNPCPAGSYCLPGGFDTAWPNKITCPAGHFCIKGSYYPRVCPPGTFSYEGSSVCTSCPLGSYSSYKSTSFSECYQVYKTFDSICTYNPIFPANSENPINSPYDCPDDRVFDITPDSRQVSFIGDDLCTGVETAANSSADCASCGNGVCDGFESIQSCYRDCSCGNGVCDSINNRNRYLDMYDKTSLLVNEHRDNCSDCYYGDGVCDTVEANSRVTYKNDCHCGIDADNNGNKCDSAAPYSETIMNCAIDCLCGNGTCDQGETFANCSLDCTCGNNKCEPEKGEKASTCSNDCKCGDNVCELSERGICAADCHCGMDADSNGALCDIVSPYLETGINCPSDCSGVNGPIIPPIEQ